jgi:effector-binding domain-containing protein
VLQLNRRRPYMEYGIELIETEELPALSIRKTAAGDHLSQEIEAAYKAIAAYLHDLGVTKPGQPYVAYYNTNMNHLDVEIGVVTDQRYPGNDGDINAETIPAGARVSVIHKGAYREMGQRYTDALKWIKNHHYNPTGVVYEFYLNSPENVPESNLLTRIEFLLE